MTSTHRAITTCLRKLNGILVAASLLLFASGSAKALPGLCESLAINDPILLEGYTVTVDDAITFLEFFGSFSDGTKEITRELLDTAVTTWVVGESQIPVLDAITMTMRAVRFADTVQRGNTEQGMCYLLSDAVGLISSAVLQQAGLQGLAATASAATFLMTYPLEVVLDMLDGAAWRNQKRLYDSARALGYSPEAIAAKQGGDHLVYDDRGWLLVAGDVCVLWGCGYQSLARIPVRGSSPSEVYAIFEKLRIAAQYAERTKQDAKRLAEEIIATVAPGISVTTRYPDWAEEITFSATGRVIATAPDQSHWWNFGDGSSAVGKTVSHRYLQPGTYYVELRAPDEHGTEQWVRKQVTVLPPRIVVSAPNGGSALSRSFEAPDSDLIASYSWGFNDGTEPISGETARRIEKEFAQAGSSQVTLTLHLHSGALVQSEWNGHVGPGARFLRTHTIQENQVWEPGTYIIDGWITVAEGATLEIRPGVELLFMEDAQLNVHGRLQANSASFKAFSDSAPWLGVYIESASSSRIENSTFEGANGTNWGMGGVIDIWYGEHLVSENTITSINAGGQGITVAYGAAPEIRDNSVTGFVEGIRVGWGWGGGPVDASPSVLGNLLSNNDSGLVIGSGACGTYERNRLEANQYGLDVTAGGCFVVGEGNIFAGNSDADVLAGGTLTGAMVWPKGVTVRIAGTLAVSEGAALEIDSGVEVLFSRAGGIDVSGTLVVLDASFKGAAPDQPWAGIRVSGAGARFSWIKGAMFEHGMGADFTESGFWQGGLGVLDIVGSSPTVRDSTFRGRADGLTGISVRNDAAPLLAGNVIAGFASDDAAGIRVDDGGNQGSAPTLTGNTMRDNWIGLRVLYGSGLSIAADNVFSDNSHADVLVSGTLTGTVAWPQDLNVRVEGWLTIAEGATLRIDPGAELLFEGSGGLSVQGTLLADGASFRAVDTEQPWSGVQIGATASDATTISNSVFEDGLGVGWAGWGYWDGGLGLLDIEGSSPAVRDSTFRGRADGLTGISVRNGAAPVLAGNIVEGFSGDDAAGIRVDEPGYQASAPTLTGNSFRNNWIGLRVHYDSDLTIAEDNVFADNSHAGVLVSGTLTGSITWPRDLVVRVQGWLTIAEGATLRIDPGAELLFEGSGGLSVQGTLLADGASFRAVDTEQPWSGVQIGATASDATTISNSVFEDGLGVGWAGWGYWDGGLGLLDIEGSSPAVRDSTFRGRADGLTGISVRNGAAPVLAGNIVEGFSGDDAAGIRVDEPGYQASAPTLTGNSFRNNWIGLGVRYGSDLSIAEDNVFTDNTHAGVLVSGTLTGSITWPRDLIVRVSGWLTIAETATLAIEPGAEILFEADGGIIAYGTLIADGADFRSAHASQDWSGIRVHGLWSDATSLADCVVADARGDGFHEGAIDIRNSSPLLSRVTVNGTPDSVAGITVRDGAAPTISDSYITGVTRESGTAVSVAGTDDNPSAPALWRNVVAGNWTGLHIGPGSGGAYTDNTIRENRTGIEAQFGGSRIVLTGTTLSLNSLVDFSVTGTINGHVIWPEESRILVSGPLSLEEGATLEVHTDAQALFSSGLVLTVYGTLLADGAAFGAMRSDQTWVGIQMIGPGADNARIEACSIEDAVGGWYPGWQWYWGWWGYRAGGALDIQSSTPELVGNTIVGNDSAVAGISIRYGASPTITGNTVAGFDGVGATAIAIDGDDSENSSPVLSGNLLRDNWAAIRVAYPSRPSIANDNVFSANAHADLVVAGTVQDKSVWPQGITVSVHENLTVAASGSLAIGNSTDVAVADAKGISAYGTLTASNVSFRPADPGLPWAGIQIIGASASDTLLESCSLEGARGFGWWRSDWWRQQIGVIDIVGSAPTIRSTAVTGDVNAETGISVRYGARPSLERLLVHGFSIQGGTGVRIGRDGSRGAHPALNESVVENNWIGVEVYGENGGEFQGNAFIGNTLRGFLRTGTSPVSAASNYWGHATGPSDTSDDRAAGGAYNPLGRGDSVSDLVEYVPWLQGGFGDADGDGVPDDVDADDDNDGIADDRDVFPEDPGEWADTDGDGIGNEADADDDGDGIPDGSDNCPLVANMDQRDRNQDGIGDACDTEESFCFQCLPSTGGWRAILR